MFTAIIYSDMELEQSNDLIKLFSFEDKIFTNNRASYTIEQEKPLTIKITAQDAVSLRAVFNSVTKVLGIYEKTIKVLKNE